MIAAALLVAATCSGDCSAQKQFEQMEEALVRQPVEGKVFSHADGSVSADIEATLTIGGDTKIDYKGNVMGKDVDSTYKAATTPELRDAILIGMARMGLLHNIVSFTRDRPPANVEGHVREALIAHDFAKAPGGGISYKLRAGNREMGESVIKINSKSHFPMSRQFTAHLDNGDMHVSETYRLVKMKQP
jgi:hypothetical protein